jgi:hypothetical protein
MDVSDSEDSSEQQARPASVLLAPKPAAKAPLSYTQLPLVDPAWRLAAYRSVCSCPPSSAPIVGSVMPPAISGPVAIPVLAASVTPAEPSVRAGSAPVVSRESRNMSDRECLQCSLYIYCLTFYRSSYSSSVYVSPHKSRRTIPQQMVRRL